MKHGLTKVALVLAALVAFSGCTFFDADPDSVSNTCSTDSDCVGGVCADIGGKSACLATGADIPGLILEVQPSTEASYGAGTSFLVPFGGYGLKAQSVAGIVIDRDIVLPHSVVSPIELFIDYDFKGCSLPSTRKVPADFIFYRNSMHDGLPDHEAAAIALENETDSYVADLPQGIYDMLVIPRVPDGCSAAPPPPSFHRELDVSKGGDVDLHLTTPPHVISGTVGFPKGQDLTGWSIQVVEPKRGKPISSTQALEVEPLNLYASYVLEYFWKGTPDASPVLRLSPPEGVNAPRLFWEVAALNPLEPNAESIEANLVLVDLDAVGRDVNAFVVDTKGFPVASTVTFRSSELSGNASNNANYSIVVDSDHDGRFTTKLLPGKYKVIAHPTFDTTKAVTTDEWEITTDDDCICGKAIIIQDKFAISGMVALPDRTPLIWGTASVYPSRSPERPYLSSRLATDASISPIASAPLGSSGDFSLLVDPGLADLLVVPPPGSLFPWLVHSQLDFQPKDSKEMVDLTSLKLSYPAILRGIVRSPDEALVTSGAVRAWMPVAATGFDGTVVIQIGETMTGADGRFTLPLAPSFSK